MPTRKYIHAIVPAALACAAFLLPASGASAKVSPKAVDRAADRAQVMLGSAIDAATEGKARRVERRLSRAERLTQRSARAASRVARSSHPRRGARSYKLAAEGADAGFDSVAGSIAALPAHVQDKLADALERFGGLRGRLVERLTALAESLPEPARMRLLDAIGGFHDQGDLAPIVEAIGDPDVSAALRDRLTGVLGKVSDRLSEALGQLEGLTGTLPAPAGERVADAIGVIQGTLGQVFEMLDGILGSLPIGGGLLPGGGGGPGDVDLGGVLPGGDGLPVDICRIVERLPIPIPVPGLCASA